MQNCLFTHTESGVTRGADVPENSFFIPGYDAADDFGTASRNEVHFNDNVEGTKFRWEFLWNGAAAKGKPADKQHEASGSGAGDQCTVTKASPEKTSTAVHSKAHSGTDAPSYTYSPCGGSSSSYATNEHWNLWLQTGSNWVDENDEICASNCYNPSDQSSLQRANQILMWVH
jgi:hypothetical protein